MKISKRFRWLALAACLCIVLGGGLIIYQRHFRKVSYYQSTLIGAAEIYPTVMADGRLYEWHKGAAILDELPKDCTLHGNINHIKGKTPQKNGDFVSVFQVTGTIYTTKDKSNIYLKLTTDWMQNAIVKFDLVE